MQSHLLCMKYPIIVLQLLNSEWKQASKGGREPGLPQTSSVSIHRQNAPISSPPDCSSISKHTGNLKMKLKVRGRWHSIFLLLVILCIAFLCLMGVCWHSALEEHKITVFPPGRSESLQPKPVGPLSNIKLLGAGSGDKILSLRSKSMDDKWKEIQKTWQQVAYCIKATFSFSCPNPFCFLAETQHFKCSFRHSSLLSATFTELSCFCWNSLIFSPEVNTTLPAKLADSTDLSRWV